VGVAVGDALGVVLLEPVLAGLGKLELHHVVESSSVKPITLLTIGWGASPLKTYYIMKIMNGAAHHRLKLMSARVSKATRIHPTILYR